MMQKKLGGIVAVIFIVSLGGPAFAVKPIDNDPMVALGQLVYEDPNLSANENQSCMSCHHPNAGFADPVNHWAPMYRPVSEGSVRGLFGGRSAPVAAYAKYSPVFKYNDVDETFYGGLFWDGRATGREDVTATSGLGAGATKDPLADQAKGPFLNAVEMALESEEEVVQYVNDAYGDLYAAAFGDIGDVGVAYNNISLAIAAFEKSGTLNRFKSKFDRFRDEQGGDVSTFMTVPQGFSSGEYTLEEAEGLALFNDPAKGNCAACHPTAAHDAKTPPVFTDFSYDNLGIPVNPKIAELAGDQSIDYGLGAQVAQLEAAFGGDLELLVINGSELAVVAAEAGKFKVPTLRNIVQTAPYGHNGFFPTLYSIVHFYNTRDVPGAGWAPPEVDINVNREELGNLGLTFEEEQKIVLFLNTLTDDK